MTVDPANELSFVLAVIVGLLSVARVVRLVVDDDLPAVKGLREWWVERASVDWKPLVECPFCVAPYVAGPAVLWFASLVAWPHWTANLWVWWIVNGWAAVSYAAAMITVRDIPPADRE